MTDTPTGPPEQDPDDVVDLDPAADARPENNDHPDEVTAAEAEDGKAMYHRVDDLDDNSNGLG